MLSSPKPAEPIQDEGPRPQILYFCDESSQSDDTYMAVGGIAVSKDAIPYIISKMTDIRTEFGKQGEVKWKNAKSRSGVVHQAYIKLLFSLIQEGRLHFHIRFSRMDEYDHKLSGSRKRIDTASKAFYQLLLHRPMAYYGKDVDLYVYPDDGDCTVQLPDQIDALNWEASAAYSARPVKIIQPKSSAREPMLQLLDCTLGALAAYRNGRHENPDISEVKRKLAALAFEQTRWPDITGNCWKDKKKLNRWNAIPKIKKGQ